jgi:hypothetical protein
MLPFFDLSNPNLFYNVLFFTRYQSQIFETISLNFSEPMATQYQMTPQTFSD